MTMAPSTKGPGINLRSLLLAALVLYVYRLVAGFLVAYPAARALGSVFAAPFPDGDAVLFASGGFYLLEALRLGTRTVASVLEGASASGGLLLFAGLFPLAVALSALATPAARASAAFTRGLRHVPAFMLLSGTTWLARVIYAVAAAGVLSVVTSATRNVANEKNADLAVAAAGFLLALGVVAIEVLLDLARAAVVAHGETPRAAATAALRTLVTRPGPIAAYTLGVTVLGGLAIAAAACLTGVLDVSRAGGGRIATVFVVHQLVIVVLVVLRAAWLHAALRLLDASPSAIGAAGSGRDGLAIDLDVPTSGTVPGEIEPHDAPSQ